MLTPIDAALVKYCDAYPVEALRVIRQDALLFYADAWKRIGPNQRGQKCGRGWVGLKGACQRAKRGATEEEKQSLRKQSAQALAQKIRTERGIGKPKKTSPSPKGKTSLNLARGAYEREGYLTTEAHSGWTNGYLAKLSPSSKFRVQRDFASASDKDLSRAGNGRKYYKLSGLDDGVYEAETIAGSYKTKRHYLQVEGGQVTNKFNDIDEAIESAYPGTKAARENLETAKAKENDAKWGALSGSEKQIKWANDLRSTGHQSAIAYIDTLGQAKLPVPLDEFKSAVNQFVKNQSSSRDWIDNRGDIRSWILLGAYKAISDKNNPS